MSWRAVEISGDEMCRQRSTDPLPNWGGQFTVAGISIACGFDCLPKHNDPSRSRLNSCIWATPTRSLAWPRFDESLCYGGQSKPSAICWQRLSTDPTLHPIGEETVDRCLPAYRRWLRQPPKHRDSIGTIPVQSSRRRAVDFRRPQPRREGLSRRFFVQF